MPVKSWLNRQCQIGEVVYEGTLSSNQPDYKEKKYFGIAEESFKERLYNHNLLSDMNLIKTTQNFLRSSKNDVISKETIILQIYGNRWLISKNDLTEDWRKDMKQTESIA